MWEWKAASGRLAFCKPFHSANWNQWYFKKGKKSWNRGKESTFLVFPSLSGIEFIVCQAITSTDRTYSRIRIN